MLILSPPLFFLRARLAAILLIIFLLFSSTGSLAAEWIYTVQSGDDLWSLSKRYLISIRYREKLQNLNHITDPIHIPVGTRLRFPIEWLKSGSSIARILHTHGKVTMSAGETGKIRPLKKGMILWEKDTIRTGAESSVILEFSDGSQIQLQSESRLLLEVMKSYGETGMVNTKVKLLKGRTRNKVIPRSGPGSRFEIITPSAAAAVRGTEYRISVQDNEESRAEVLKGEVALGSKGATRSLPGGFGSVAFMDKAPLMPVDLLPAPDISTFPQTLTRLPFFFTLKPLDGATAYRLHISKARSFDILLYDGLAKSTHLSFSALPDGKYFLRVRGIDKHGLEGLESIHPFTLDARPLPPVLLLPKADANTSTSPLTFQWTALPEAAGYAFQLADNQAFEHPITSLSRYQKASYTLPRSLKPGSYYWRVATVLSAGKQGPFSTPYLLRNPPPPPDLSRAQFHPKNHTFSWQYTDSNGYYRVQIAQDSTFTDIIDDRQVQKTEYILNDLENGEYSVRVAVISADGLQGPFSDPQHITISPPFNPWVPSLVALATLLIML